jgi:hypothetical protein
MGEWRWPFTLALRLWLVVRWGACVEFVVVKWGLGVEERVRVKSIISISYSLVVSRLKPSTLIWVLLTLPLRFLEQNNRMDSSKITGLFCEGLFCEGLLFFRVLSSVS